MLRGANDDHKVVSDLWSAICCCRFAPCPILPFPSARSLAFAATDNEANSSAVKGGSGLVFDASLGRSGDGILLIELELR